MTTDEMFEVCGSCQSWHMYHRAEDDACPIPPIYEADTVIKRRQFGTTYFTSDTKEGGE